jgi:nitroimidazol reductase NimA-like FMN-containing flavoprotein (pyridoxamine 5'-phosphate oxidase superfamily)
VSDRKPVTFRELSRAECDELLSRNHVARIAFSYHDHVDIEPIHYVHEGEWIYGRTGDGTKLKTLAHNRWLALETDEVSNLFDWKSVVVKGSLFLLESQGPGAEHHAHAIDLLRSLYPATLTDQDHVPERNVVFRIHLDQVSGRAAES